VRLRMTTAIAVVVGGKRQAKQASQNNTDYTEKQWSEPLN